MCFLGKFYKFLGLALLLLALTKVAYAAEETYTVRGVSVDVTAETAALAKDKAFNQAKQDALLVVLQRLLPKAEIDTIGSIDKLPVNKWVSGLEVNSEKTSRVRYIGNLNVFFNPTAIRDFLSNKNYSFDESARQTWLVLPIYDLSDVPMIWEKENAWRATWVQLTQIASVVPFRVPFGDAIDQKTFSAASLSLGDVEAIRSLSQRYQAPNVLLVTAKLLTKGTDPSNQSSDLEVKRFKFDGIGLVELPKIVESGGVGETQEALMQRAAQTILKTLNEVKAATLEEEIDYGLEPQMDVLIPVADLGDWLRVDSHLRTLSGLRQYRVRAISPRMVQMYWEPAVGVGQLNNSLRLISRKLVPSNDVWILQPAGSIMER